jgi:OOP family OmpA-OmpF porin
MDDAFREEKMMLSRRAVRYLSSLGFLSVVGFFVVGCTLDESPTIKQISSARDAIDAAEKEGAKERFPGEFADLEQQYLKVRGVYYACNESEASALAQQLIADANALASKEVAMAPAPNQPPLCAFTVEPGVVNQLLSFSADESSDPDGTITSYRWDYGDGTTADFTFPRATHRYTSPGTYMVQLACEDDKGSVGTASQEIMVSEAQTMSIDADVLFDFDKSEIRPDGVTVLQERVLDPMLADPQLMATLIGHTDSVGPEEYNMGLSERRAKAVQQYLTDNGIAADRLNVDWRGESEPVAPNDTPEGRQQNRRVDVNVTAKGIQ